MKLPQRTAKKVILNNSFHLIPLLKKMGIQKEVIWMLAPLNNKRVQNMQAKINYLMRRKNRDS